MAWVSCQLLCGARELSYSKKVSLSRCRILNDLESDIIIRERLVASFRFAKLASVTVVISIIQAMLGVGSIVARVVQQSLRSRVVKLRSSRSSFRSCLSPLGSSRCSYKHQRGALCLVASTSSPSQVLVRIEDEDRHESVVLILSMERACVLGLEMGEQEQDVVRSQHRLVLWFVVQSVLVFQYEDILY